MMVVRWMVWLAAMSLVLLLSAFSLPVQYSKIRIHAPSDADLRQLALIGLPLDEVRRRGGGDIDLFVTGDEVRLLKEKSIPFEVLIHDWRSAYASRMLLDQSTLQSKEGIASPNNFHLGSMGGYLKLSEIVAELEAMRKRYPALVGGLDTIGRSVKGRPLWGIKLSWNPTVAEDEPRVLYTALHHGREPIGVMQMVYFMWYLLQNYGNDEQVTSILNSRELYFVPVVNPDGYAENERTDPQGGGMWRKNLRDNGDGSMGVDLNRNYGYQWGVDNFGSSDKGSADTFRGKGAFSEPETQAIRDLCKAKRFSLALNYHSFGNLLIYPWGYADRETPDSLLFRQFGAEATTTNYFEVGKGADVLYFTNGDSDDWMYGDTLAKPKILALTAEVGSDEDGFWPVPSRIIPLAQEMLGMNLYAARAGGPLLDVSASEFRRRQGSDSTEIVLQITNKGLRTPSASVVLDLKGTNTVVTGPSSFSSSWTLKSPLVLCAVRPSGVSNGTLAQVQVTLTYDGGRSVNTIEFRHGSSVELMFDDADSIRRSWTSVTNKPTTRWDVTTERYWSRRTSYAESPAGDYDANVSCTFTMKETLLLDGTAAEMRFNALWDIEAAYDMALVEVSSDGGGTWKALTGQHTRPASEVKGGKQVAGLHGYDRKKRGWVEEVINLDAFLGKTVLLRWRFESDAYEQRDGIYIDNIRVLLYPRTIFSNASDGTPVSFRLEQNYPNPFNPKTDIRFQVPDFELVALRVYDLLGREVTTIVNEVLQPGIYHRMFDASGLASGVYIYRLRAGEKMDVRRMMVLK